MAPVSIALNRFGLGARPDEVAPVDPRKWLTAQFADYQVRPAALADTPTRAKVAADVNAYQRGEQIFAADVRAEVKDGMAMSGGQAKPSRASEPDRPINVAARALRQNYVRSVGARANIALTSPAPFVERLVHFWSNHFAVSTDVLGVDGLCGPFEFEAIRPHVLGRFHDMLTAVERHPAMLTYLNQDRSFGPNSPVGKRFTLRDGRPQFGINENLAREILELHTLGARTGYSQADVTEFARAMTGRMVYGMGSRFADRFGPPAEPGDYVFVEGLREPGARTIMGKRYDQPGEAQSQAVIDDLAGSPATAGHIATKLARHFCGDTPPPALVGRLKTAFLRTGGDLPALYGILIDAEEAWTPTPCKFRTPWEWSIAMWRALGMRTILPETVVGLVDQLGQPTWKPGQPNGYDDIAASWASPDAVLRRVEAAHRFAVRAGPIDARALAPKLFPGALSPATTEALARATGPGQALALLLVAPEMMRR